MLIEKGINSNQRVKKDLVISLVLFFITLLIIILLL